MDQRSDRAAGQYESGQHGTDHDKTSEDDKHGSSTRAASDLSVRPAQVLHCRRPSIGPLVAVYRDIAHEQGLFRFGHAATRKIPKVHIGRSGGRFARRTVVCLSSCDFF